MLSRMLVLKDGNSNEAELRRKFGRWLPQDRYSLDQVPCNLVEGDGRTYHFKGADENVWIASNGKTDEHKRFCTLQLSVKVNANLGNTRIC